MAITQIHSQPERQGELQFPPAISIGSNDVFFWMSGATAIPLYHMHPHIDEECVLPDDIREQARRILVTFDEVLRFNGLGWKNVVKFSQFLTDMREYDAVQEVIDGVEVQRAHGGQRRHERGGELLPPRMCRGLQPATPQRHPALHTTSS